MGRRANEDKTPAERYAKHIVKATFSVMDTLTSDEQKNAFLEYTKVIMLYIEQIASCYANNIIVIEK